MTDGPVISGCSCIGTYHVCLGCFYAGGLQRNWLLSGFGFHQVLSASTRTFLDHGEDVRLDYVLTPKTSPVIQVLK